MLDEKLRKSEKRNFAVNTILAVYRIIFHLISN